MNKFIDETIDRQVELTPKEKEHLQAHVSSDVILIASRRQEGSVEQLIFMNKSIKKIAAHFLNDEPVVLVVFETHNATPSQVMTGLVRNIPGLEGLLVELSKIEVNKTKHADVRPRQIVEFRGVGMMSTHNPQFLAPHPILAVDSKLSQIDNLSSNEDIIQELKILQVYGNLSMRAIELMDVAMRRLQETQIELGVPSLSSLEEEKINGMPAYLGQTFKPSMRSIEIKEAVVTHYFQTQVGMQASLSEPQETLVIKSNQDGEIISREFHKSSELFADFNKSQQSFSDHVMGKTRW